LYRALVPAAKACCSVDRGTAGVEDSFGFVTAVAGLATNRLAAVLAFPACETLEILSFDSWEDRAPLPRRDSEDPADWG
jgi:hypothetical protein